MSQKIPAKIIYWCPYCDRKHMSIVPCPEPAVIISDGSIVWSCLECEMSNYYLRQHRCDRSTRREMDKKDVGCAWDE